MVTYSIGTFYKSQTLKRSSLVKTSPFFFRNTTYKSRRPQAFQVWSRKVGEVCLKTETPYGVYFLDRMESLSVPSFYTYWNSGSLRTYRSRGEPRHRPRLYHLPRVSVQRVGVETHLVVLDNGVVNVHNTETDTFEDIYLNVQFT